MEGKLAKGLEVTGIDEASNSVHVLESRDPNRWILGVLFHPERSFESENSENLSSDSLALVCEFIKKCREFQGEKKKYVVPLID